MRYIHYTLLAALVCVLFFSVDSKRIEGRLDTGRQWHFLTKFAFHEGSKVNNSDAYTNEGRLSFNISSAPNAKLYFYMLPSFRNKADWATVYENAEKWSCKDLTDNAQGFHAVSDPPHYQLFGETVPRYWFFAIADCDGKDGIHTNYYLHLTNSDSAWDKELSYDQADLPGLYLFFFLFFVFGLAAHAYGMWSLYRSDFLHPVVKLLSATIFIYFLSILCQFIHWISYKNNGVGSPFMNGAGDYLDFLAQILFTLLLLLIAKGWAISTTEVNEKKIIGGITVVFAILYLSLFIYARTKWDPASTLYIYETAPGIVLLVIRALTLIYFVFSLRYGVLHESHPSKRRFYQIFTAVYTAWFLSLHLIVIVAAIRVPEQRIKTVEPFYVTVNTIALGILAFLFWPTQIVKYFDVRPSEGLLSGSTSSPYETL